MKNILIIGATSAIAEKCAQLWAEEKANFFLVARNPEKLQQVANDLKARGAAEINTYDLDLNQLEQHKIMLAACESAFQKIDIVLIAHGTLSDQLVCENNTEILLKEYSTNCLSVISLLMSISRYMEKQQSGVLAVISSVAGDRGRSSNYVYGSAKAAVTSFCSGLRQRLFKSHVHVLTIKPGFVETPMTQELALPKLLLAKPEKVAKDIVKAIQSKKNTLYTPWFWTLIMLIIKLIPEPIFKRITL